METQAAPETESPVETPVTEAEDTTEAETLDAGAPEVPEIPEAGIADPDPIETTVEASEAVVEETIAQAEQAVEIAAQATQDAVEVSSDTAEAVTEIATEAVAEAVPEQPPVPVAEGAPVAAASPEAPAAKPTSFFRASATFGFVPSLAPLNEINATLVAYARNEGAAALAHIQALSKATSPAEVIRLQVDELQRVADASLTCISDIVRSANRFTESATRH
ncbi:Phasin [Methylobacterium organophilum]|uniref:Phasin n=1 Tax=Methylobacterium organophilum TaxID=410 RepID=UPI001EE2B8D6|nr:Phasin [Methylobacterium organophilum]